MMTQRQAAFRAGIPMIVTGALVAIGLGAWIRLADL